MEDVKLQIYADQPGGPTMQGFVKSYFQKRQDVSHSRRVMYCFPPEKVPVLATLARKYCVFNRWFSSWLQIRSLGNSRARRARLALDS